MISRLLSHRMWWAWALFAVFFAFGGARAQAITSNYIGDPFTSVLYGKGIAEQDFFPSISTTFQEVKRGKSASFLVTAPNDITAFEITCEPPIPNAICSYTLAGMTAIVEVDTSPGKKGTPKGSYTIIFTATSGDTRGSRTVTLVVK